tara:strand:- start:2924 stop:3556 length:633 start_codon:yes stop_codon:yes gene_type:complete
MHLASRLSLIAALVFPAGCASTGHSAPDAALAASWLHGTFSSLEQSEADEDYFHIRLAHEPIWTEREGEHWLYVEQAVASTPDKPYRQRVYRVSVDGAEVRSQIFELPGDVTRFVGGCEDPARFDAMSPDDLVPVEGCSVFLSQLPDSFSGSTRDDACKNAWGGATYATSIVELRADRILSWDRGYDADGAQVWGAEQGPYVFERIESTP